MKIDEFVQENYQAYIDDINSWVDTQYQKHFKDCFNQVKQIHDRMNSQTRTITDSELEWVLTELPMMLFSISEDLNKVRLEAEVIKLRKKSIKLDYDKAAADLVKLKELSKADTKSWVDSQLVEHDVLLAAYTSLITWVESEISFSRELIMGCKKIWDARRKTEAVNPVGEVTPSPKAYNHYPNGVYSEPYKR